MVTTSVRPPSWVDHTEKQQRRQQQQQQPEASKRRSRPAPVAVGGRRVWEEGASSLSLSGGSLGLWPPVSSPENSASIHALPQPLGVYRNCAVGTGQGGNPCAFTSVAFEPGRGGALLVGDEAGRLLRLSLSQNVYAFLGKRSGPSSEGAVVRHGALGCVQGRVVRGSQDSEHSWARKWKTDGRHKDEGGSAAAATAAARAAVVGYQDGLVRTVVAGADPVQDKTFPNHHTQGIVSCSTAGDMVLTSSVEEAVLWRWAPSTRHKGQFWLQKRKEVRPTQPGGIVDAQLLSARVELEHDRKEYEVCSYVCLLTSDGALTAWDGQTFELGARLDSTSLQRPAFLSSFSSPSHAAHAPPESLSIVAMAPCTASSTASSSARQQRGGGGGGKASSRVLVSCRGRADNSLLIVWDVDSDVIVGWLEDLPVDLSRVVQMAMLEEAGGSEVVLLLDDSGLLTCLSLLQDASGRSSSFSLAFQLRSEDAAACFTGFAADQEGKFVALLREDGMLVLHGMRTLLASGASGLGPAQSGGGGGVNTSAQETRQGKGEGAATTAGGAKGAYRRVKVKPSSRVARPVDAHPASLSLVSQLPRQELPHLSRKDLRALLRAHGAFPAQHRRLAWKCLLKLPGNHQAMQALVAKGPNPACAGLEERYPLRNQSHFAKLSTALSALAHWSPVFGEAEYVPAVVFPMVVVFGPDDLAAFEASMSVLLHWGQHWLVTFPQPPVPVLMMLQAVLKRRHPRLVAHLASLSVDASLWGWALLRTIFTEVLGQQDWLQLWDHLFAAAPMPGLLNASVVAFMLHKAGELLTLRSRAEVEVFIHRQHVVQMKHFLKLMYSVGADERSAGFEAQRQKRAAAFDFGAGAGAAAAATARADHSAAAAVAAAGRGEAMLTESTANRCANPGVMSEVEENLRGMLGDVGESEFPLQKGEYPDFHGYPKFVVNYQIRERMRVVKEEEELSMKQQLVGDLRLRAEALREEEEAWQERKVQIAKEEGQRLRQAGLARKERMERAVELDKELVDRRLQVVLGREMAAQRRLDLAAELRQEESARMARDIHEEAQREERELARRLAEEETVDVEQRVQERLMHMYAARREEARLRELREVLLNKLRVARMEEEQQIALWEEENKQRRSEWEEERVHAEEETVKVANDAALADLERAVQTKIRAGGQKLSALERSRAISAMRDEIRRETEAAAEGDARRRDESVKKGLREVGRSTQAARKERRKGLEAELGRVERALRGAVAGGAGQGEKGGREAIARAATADARRLGEEAAARAARQTGRGKSREGKGDPLKDWDEVGSDGLVRAAALPKRRKGKTQGANAAVKVAAPAQRQEEEQAETVEVRHSSSSSSGSSGNSVDKDAGGILPRQGSLLDSRASSSLMLRSSEADSEESDRGAKLARGNKRSGTGSNRSTVRSSSEGEAASTSGTSQKSGRRRGGREAAADSLPSGASSEAEAESLASRHLYEAASARERSFGAAESSSSSSNSEQKEDD